MIKVFSRHFGRHLVDSLVDTFLRERDTLHTLQVFNPIINKNRHYPKYVYTESVSSVYFLKKTVYGSVYKLSTKVGVWF